MVLTVSPVPLTATFTDKDVVTANMYSKSVLRTVALNVARMAVAYAPSPASADIARRLMPREVLARLPAGF